ncbi:uncharacterized protein LOC117117031 [Anneissia japonica]|uniref:uncharacterized protein LOC117117031 n=1 Tax=Anneissia japonica TaxID=1529436 RepID=UPI001425A499|nr:uncharacterized protein LOC117117031 [Anneissia japonica]
MYKKYPFLQKITGHINLLSYFTTVSTTDYKPHEGQEKAASRLNVVPIVTPLLVVVFLSIVLSLFVYQRMRNRHCYHNNVALTRCTDKNQPKQPPLNEVVQSAVKCHVEDELYATIVDIHKGAEGESKAATEYLVVIDDYMVPTQLSDDEERCTRHDVGPALYDATIAPNN